MLFNVDDKFSPVNMYFLKAEKIYVLVNFLKAEKSQRDNNSFHNFFKLILILVVELLMV